MFHRRQHSGSSRCGISRSLLLFTIPSCKHLEGCLKKTNEIIAQNIGSRITLPYEMKCLVTWGVAVWKMREAKTPKDLFNHFMVVFIT